MNTYKINEMISKKIYEKYVKKKPLEKFLFGEIYLSNIEEDFFLSLSPEICHNYVVDNLFFYRYFQSKHNYMIICKTLFQFTRN